jgi:hypothetical protein
MRRYSEFLLGTALLALFLVGQALPSKTLGQEPTVSDDQSALEREFRDPPREFTLLPFWFWNDELTNDEIARQIEDFDRHGVHGFTIHPRIGLPEDCGWMSPKLLAAMRFALEEAERRDMRVMLYDEGMYPSGASAGQVVEEDPAYSARGFVRAVFAADGTQLEPRPRVQDDWILIEEYQNDKGETIRIYDAPSGGVIRGLHYIGDESNRPREFSPPAADLLYAPAVDAFIRLVYQRYYDEFEEFFKSGVIVGIFTDEPSILGRGAMGGMKNGSLRSLDVINNCGGMDFRPHLRELWETTSPESATIRARYNKAVQLALEEIYYDRISRWCVEHGTNLCGHPEGSGDIGVLSKFQTPGQDIVWRYIEPGAKAFDPRHSVMAKVASSAALHNGARRNLNEIFGAYGHDLTYEECVWLINWCVARGQNMFLPHAFFYSIRGPRFDERPPDVGPHSEWWEGYNVFADYCARLCWLNTDSQVVAPTAILVDSGVAPVWMTRELTRNQLDFNYLETRLLKDAQIALQPEPVIALPSASYKTLLTLPSAATLASPTLLNKAATTGRLICLKSDSSRFDKLSDAPIAAENEEEILELVRRFSGVDVATIAPENAQKGDATPAFPSLAPGLRARHVIKGGVDFYFLFNEEADPIDAFLTFAADDGSARVREWDPSTGSISDVSRNPERPTIFRIKLSPHETRILSFR